MTEWETIKKKNPKAFKKFVKWLDCDSSDMLQFELMMILKNERELFDFFDDMDIHIYIHPSLLSKLGRQCTFSILQDDGESMSATKVDNRKKTETTAFEKAFNLLEKQ